MLDAFIIEQIRRREEQDSNCAHQENRLQLPVPFVYEEPRSPAQRQNSDDAGESPSDGNRGVIVIDF